MCICFFFLIDFFPFPLCQPFKKQPVTSQPYKLRNRWQHERGLCMRVGWNCIQQMLDAIFCGKTTYKQRLALNRARPESLNGIGGMELNFHTDNQRRRVCHTCARDEQHKEKKENGKALQDKLLEEIKKKLGR